MKKVMTNFELMIPVSIIGVTMLTGAFLVSSGVSADDIVDEINITVPMSCTMAGTGMDTHNANINNGTYTPNIGTTTMHVFCNDNAGFSIYAAGYTGDEIGGTNSNKLVGTSASGNATIESGLATSAGSPDVSNWAMKLAITQDSGDTTGTNAFTIDSAPNVALPSQAEQGATAASFSNYHVVPNEYVKVAHKISATDMTANTGGAKITSTYAAYISKTQPADIYSGQVKYTLVHPHTAPEPVRDNQIGVTYNANGSTFAGGGTTNRVVYASSPMYIAATPLIAKSSNVANDGTKTTAYASNVNDLVPVTASGASKMKVVITYGVTSGTGLAIAEGNWDGQSMPDVIIAQNENLAGTETYVFNGDTVTFNLNDFSGDTPITDYDYGFWAQVYPVYITEQSGAEQTSEFVSISVGDDTYAQTTNWYGSWYADIDNQHYDFINESEVVDFLNENVAMLGGTNIDLNRGLTFAEAYTRASKTQDGGYYKQQDLNNSICQTVAITQTQTVKDVRDNNTYMIGRLKDGRCWMLDNLALDPTDSTTAANMSASNTNATTEAITNYLNGGSSTTGWSNVAVVNKTSGWNTTSSNTAYTQPYINNQSKNTLVTSYGPASANGQTKVGVYYNFCAATVGTYCYESSNGIILPGTFIDAPQDVCPANWRMPTGGPTGEYLMLYDNYNTTQDAISSASLQYNLSTSLSGSFYGDAANNQDGAGSWWSSTYHSNYDMYFMFAYPVYVETENGSTDRSFGHTMRCLVSN